MLIIEAVFHMPAIFLEIYYMPKIDTFYSTKISGGNTVLYQISHCKSLQKYIYLRSCVAT